MIIENNHLKDAIEAFQKRFLELVKQFDYKNDEIYNMDEISLPFEIVPRKLITKKVLKLPL